MQKIINADFRILKEKNLLLSDEILNKISLFATGLKKQNIKEAEIYLNNTDEFIIAFFATMSLGLEIFVLQKESLNDKFNINDENFSSILNAANGKKSAININPQSIFYMQTSGSSSVAKKIPKSIEQMLNEAKAIQSLISMKNDEKIVANIPYQHLFGLSFKIFLPLNNGAMIENQTYLFPEMLINYALTSSNITLLCTATALNALLKYDLEPIKNNITRIITAGSKLPNELKNKISLKLPNTKLLEIYGSTETGVIAYNSGDKLRLFNGVEAMLDKEQKLIINSAWLKNKIITQNFISNDCAQIKGDEIILLGRSDRMVKIHEKRFNLDSVESIIRQNPLIDECHAGLEDDKNRFSVILTLSAEGKNAFRLGGRIAVINALKPDLNKHFGNEIRYFYIREFLPYNVQGKISKEAFLNECKKQHKLKFQNIEILDNLIKASIFISPSCFYFDGHFPNFPVLPGFVQLGLIYDLLEKLSIKKSDICEIENVKFTSLIHPFDTIEIEIKKEKKLYFSIMKKSKICASGRMNLCN